jgi:hypothetical protein
MTRNRLPNIGEEFATDFLFAGFMPREDSTGGGNNGNSKTSKDTGNILAADITPETGTADASESCNRRSFTDITGAHLDARVSLLMIKFVILNVAFTLEDGDNIALYLGIGDEKLDLLNADGVADSG